MSVPLTPESYLPHIGQDFVHAAADGVAHRFTLTTVDRRIDTPGQLCFSLLFQAADDQLPQAIYPLSHPTLGAFDLFLVPLQQRRGAFLYEAVFNLLRDEPQ